MLTSFRLSPSSNVSTYLFLVVMMCTDGRHEHKKKVIKTGMEALQFLKGQQIWTRLSTMVEEHGLHLPQNGQHRMENC